MFTVKEIEPKKNDLPCEWISSLIELSDLRLVSASTNGIINVYNRNSLEIEIQIYDKLNYWFSVSEIEPQKIAAPSVFGLVYIWGIYDKTYKIEKKIKANDFYVRCVLPLSNNRMAFIHNYSTIIIYSSTKPYKKKKTLDIFQNIQLNNPAIELSKPQCCIQIPNERLVAATESKNLYFWNLRNYRIIHQMKDIECYSQNSIKMINKKTLIVGGVCKIKLIDIELYQVITSYEHIPLESVYCFSILDNNNILVGGKYNLFLLKPSIELVELKKFDEEKATITQMIKIDKNKIACSRGGGQVHFIEYTKIR